MSNKAKINELDTLIRRTLRLGMEDNGSYLRIDFLYGFELFNTRAYHNYETWSGGYRVTDERNGIQVQSEDLDDALQLWAKTLEAKREGTPPKPWQINRPPECPRCRKPSAALDTYCGECFARITKDVKPA